MCIACLYGNLVPWKEQFTKRKQLWAQSAGRCGKGSWWHWIYNAANCKRFFTKVERYQYTRNKLTDLGASVLMPGCFQLIQQPVAAWLFRMDGKRACPNPEAGNILGQNARKTCNLDLYEVGIPGVDCGGDTRGPILVVEVQTWPLPGHLLKGTCVK